MLFRLLVFAGVFLVLVSLLSYSALAVSDLPISGEPDSVDASDFGDDTVSGGDIFPEPTEPSLPTEPTESETLTGGILTSFKFIVSGVSNVFDVVVSNPVLSLGIAAWIAFIAISLYRRFV